MSLFWRAPRPARRRRARARTPPEPTPPPFEPHAFVRSAIFDHRGVETCGYCPLAADRTDVHTTTELDPDVAKIGRRLVGERDEDDE